MLDLYHWEPNGASARVIIALEEKGLAYSSHYVDLLRFEQHAPEFLALNESGQVPVLVRDGVSYTEASAICEYLEEAFPGEALMPADPLGRWRVRVWQKHVDEVLAPSVCELAWQACGLAAFQALERGPAEPHRALERIQAPERRAAWQAALGGFTAEQLALARSRVEATIAKLESDLADSSWLAGPGYSLADIAVISYVKYLPALYPATLNERTTRWIRSIEARPAVRAALARGRIADPFTIAAPGPEQVRWG